MNKNGKRETSGRKNDKKAEGPHRRGRVRAHFWYQANLILMCSVTLLSLAGALLFFVQSRNAIREKNQIANRLEAVEGDEKTLYTEEEVQEKVNQAKTSASAAQRHELLMQIQSDMESGGSTASMLRKLFSDDIVVVNAGKYYFYPILKSVPINHFQSGDFALSDDGRLTYKGSSKVTLQSGINVSEENGEIDWDLVAEDDIAFAMVDAGGRLTSDSGTDEAGDIIPDDRLGDNLDGALRAGLNAGVMYHLGAVSEEEAEEEAAQLIGALKPYQDRLSYPVAVCVNVPAETDRTAGQGKTEWTRYVLTFCEALEEAGYQPMIYGNLAAFVMMLDMDDLKRYDKWIANTGASLYFPYEFSMWQYSVTGTVQGVSTEVGLDVSLTIGS